MQETRAKELNRVLLWGLRGLLLKWKTDWKEARERLNAW